MSFDAQAFLDAATSSANSTEIVPVPVGEYLGIIQDIKPRQWQSKDGTKSGIAIDITWIVEDEGVKQQLNRDTVTVKQGIMLDTDSQGNLSSGPGVNVDLGRLREAVNKNVEGEMFSFSMLPGLAARITVKHKEYEGRMLAEVKSVARL